MFSGYIAIFSHPVVWNIVDLLYIVINESLSFTL